MSATEKAQWNAPQSTVRIDIQAVVQLVGVLTRLNVLSVTEQENPTNSLMFIFMENRRFQAVFFAFYGYFWSSKGSCFCLREVGFLASASSLAFSIMRFSSLFSFSACASLPVNNSTFPTSLARSKSLAFSVSFSSSMVCFSTLNAS